MRAAGRSGSYPERLRAQLPVVPDGLHACGAPSHSTPCPTLHSGTQAHCATPPWHIPVDARVLIVPGWQRSLPAATWLQQTVGHVVRQMVVEQHDWQHPLRGDWLVQLQEAILAMRAQQPPAPIWLLAHGLGSALVWAWAASSPLACAEAGAPYAGHVQGAWLVDPICPTQPPWAQQLHRSWWWRQSQPLPAPRTAWPVWIWPSTPHGDIADAPQAACSGGADPSLEADTAMPSPSSPAPMRHSAHGGGVPDTSIHSTHILTTHHGK